ncbi:hypothetical protein BDU57DRAFT_465499 [Ampelomyces quisqualis]|uniref:RRM domain-containing protein n=1 Tax=Ampelomyces quisqualis TaxID=50730 RepID=A0A6A5R189_AMPQU|nr:hypothetical protein BDU57DRAFT_465499 [Ampelomyces quisqualis]
MPPQIKQDLNRSGWETTDFPSVCEKCLPDNPYVQMLKEDHGAECKICTRPFTIFRWKADRTARQKRTNICLTCARLKNCCQCCMLDLSFGLPIVVRDAALKMVAPGPQSDINRQYYAQEHEKEIEEGRGAMEAYQKTDEKARDLLKRLAQSEPFYKKQRRIEAESSESGQKALPAPGGAGSNSEGGHTPGPIRTKDMRGSSSGRGGARQGRGGRMGGPPAEPSPQDWLPPSDPNVASLFVTGVEDDLPEHDLRTHFAQYGKLRSLVCSHRAHCAYVNYVNRQDAETAAATLKGKVVIKGCPMRVTWGKPKQLDSLDQNIRMQYAKEGRQAAGASRRAAVQATIDSAPQNSFDSMAIAPPPGADDETNYASLRGD